MTWTAPRTWVAGEVVTAALLNAQIRDNMLVLATTPDIDDFTSSGTYTKPADLKWAVAEVWGGGASGSSAGTASAGQSAMGAGGGGGGYCRKLYAASGLSSTESVTVGVGGSGNSGAGNAGTASTFKSQTANGGVNGLSMSAVSGSSIAAGGTGGTASGGDENLTGDDGGKGQVITGIAVWINHGGGSQRGGGLATLGASAPSVGSAGKFPGGGSSGSYASNSAGQNGTTGAAGRVIVTNYFS